MPKYVFHFLDSRLDPARRELVRNGVLIELSSRAFDCLVYLVRHRDRAVGRDELISAVWGRADVSDNMLSQALLRVRRALGESNPEQSAIRTVTKFGYRWVAPTRLETCGADDGAKAPLAESERPPPAPAGDDVTLASVPAAAADAHSAPTQSSATPSVAAGAPPEIPPSRSADEVAVPAAALPAPRDAETGPRGAVESPAGPPATRARRNALLAAAVIVLALIFAIGLSALRKPAPELVAAGAGGSDVDVKALALVLPIEVHADASWEWLRFGVMDLVANRLRDGGVATLDSRNLYTLLGSHPDIAQARPDAELGLPALSRQRIYVRATLADGQWQVQLVSIEANRRLEASATEIDITTCARLAADRLLLELGHVPPSFTAASSSVQELLERTEVALLTEQESQALDLIVRAPAEIRDDPQVRVRQAQIEVRLGRYDAARARIAALLPELDADSRGLLRARALNVIAAIDVVGTQAREATPLLAESTRLAARFNSTPDLARAHELSGIQRLQVGDADGALAEFAKSRVLYASAGDPMRIASDDVRAGGAAADIARFSEAVSYYARAETTFQTLGARDSLAFARASHVMSKLELLETAGALELSNAYWPPEQHASNARTLYFLIRSHALALARNGRLGEADALLARIREQAGGDFNARVRQNAARDGVEVALRRGDFDAAIARARPLIEAAVEDPNSVTVRADSWHFLICALRARGDGAQASAETAQFNAWIERATDPKAATAASAAELRDARFLAELDRADDDAAHERMPAALERFAALLAQAQQLHVPSREVQVAALYVPALLAAQRIDQASSVAGMVSVWVDADVDAAWVQAQVYRALGQEAAYRNALQRLRLSAGEHVLPAAATGG